MSWSVSAVGKPAAVAAAIETQFAAGSICHGPEEAVRQAARTVIAAAMAGQDGAGGVRVIASGSQGSTQQDGHWGAPYTNALQITIEPLYWFVE